MDFLQNIDFGKILIQYVVLLFSLCIHESAHAWTADYFGDYTARYLGRVSLNPLVHADPIGTVLFPLLQFFSPIPLIGWAKPVPVNSAHLRNPRRDHMFISAAGPVSNILAGACFFLILLALKYIHPETIKVMYSVAFFHTIPPEPAILSPLVAMLMFGVLINFALAFFNFIPIPPLDGNWILYGLLPYRAAQAFESIRPYGFIILYALLLLGALSYIYLPVRNIIVLLFRL